MSVGYFDTEPHELLTPRLADNVSGEVGGITAARLRLAGHQQRGQKAVGNTIVLDKLAHVCREGIYLTDKSYLPDTQHSLISHRERSGQQILRAEGSCCRDAHNWAERHPRAHDPNNNTPAHNRRP